MADRILTFFIPDYPYPPATPAYYIDRDMEMAAVRVHARTAPMAGDFVFDIKANGVSIFNTNPALPKGQAIDEMAENFAVSGLDEGNWVTFDVVTPGGAKNTTVILELNYCD